MELYIRQKIFKITDHYPVLNQNEEAVFQVDQEFTLVFKKVHLSKPNGEPVLTVQQRFKLLTSSYEFQYANGDVLTLQGELTLFKRRYHLDGSDEGIRVDGNFLDMDYQITRNGEILAEVDRKYFSFADCYHVTLHDDRYAALVVAMVIAIDADRDHSKG